jgi:hypothetical protein
MSTREIYPRRPLLAPKADWYPVARAVFRFGIADAEIPELALAKSSTDSMKTGIAVSARALSVDQLAKLLKENSGAIDANIDPEQCTFSFEFYERGASVWGGPPWAILTEGSKAGTSSDPRSDAEALFNKEGIVKVSDEQAAKGAREWDAVRKATGLVWRQFMRREFDRAVETKRIILQARIGSVLEPFQALLPDVWLVLTILDWEKGIGRDPEGVLYYSMQAHRADAAVSTVAGETAAIKALALELRKNPELKRADAAAWCGKAGFKLTDRGFLDRVWPKARIQAELPEKAPPGRKSKSQR